MWHHSQDNLALHCLQGTTERHVYIMPRYTLYYLSAVPGRLDKVMLSS